MAKLLRRRPARLLSASSGASAIEVALVLPILALLMFGAIDFSNWIWSRMQVAAAARAGADYAAASGFNAPKISTAITSATMLANVAASPAPSQSCGCPNPGQGVATATCGSTCPGGGQAGRYVTASASAPYSTLLPWPGISGPISITASAQVRIN